MAKRLTDTDKWKRPWFRELDYKAKIVWFYILDNCDHAGIWPADFGLLSYQTGLKVDRRQFEEWFGSKTIFFDEDKVFIPSFFDFQYASAKDGFKAKQSALSTLRGFGLVDENGTVLEQLPNSSVTVPVLSLDCTNTGKGISKGTGTSKEGGVGETKPRVTEIDLEELYQRYPHKVGKSEGLKKLQKQIASPEDLEKLHRAMDRFISMHKKKGTDEKYLPHFSTWVSTWRDWLDADAGTVSRPVAPSPKDDPFMIEMERLRKQAINGGAEVA